MSAPASDDHGKVFLDEEDIVEEIIVDKEDSDAEAFDEADDSIHIFTGHTGELYTVACSPRDAQLVATGAGDDKGFLRKIGQGDWAVELHATGSMDQKLIISDLQHSLARCTCEHEEGVTCLSWLGVTRFVATGCVDGKVRIWDSLSSECVTVKALRGHTDAIRSLAASSNGTHLVSVSLDGTARVFEINEFS